MQEAYVKLEMRKMRKNVEAAGELIENKIAKKL